MTDFTGLVDLASERLGGAAIAANDEFFAEKENLVREAAPAFAPDRYTDRGKWMDGWETRRRREPGHDWCIVRLGLAGLVRGVIVDTSHFRGNYPESCSIDACATDRHPGTDTLTGDGENWAELLSKSPLQGDAQNRFDVASGVRATHVRLNIFPDGGVARLRVFGEVQPDWPRILKRGAAVDLAAIEHGGLVLEASDMFFGSRHNLIMPGPSRGMHDGWETRRRRGPGHDWAIVRMGRPGSVLQIEVDTSHFKGNAPGQCSVDARDAEGPWRELLPHTRLQPHTRHLFDIDGDPRASAVRLNIFPDGGVARLRVFGRPAD